MMTLTSLHSSMSTASVSIGSTTRRARGCWTSSKSSSSSSSSSARSGRVCSSISSSTAAEGMQKRTTGPVITSSLDDDHHNHHRTRTGTRTGTEEDVDVDVERVVGTSSRRVMLSRALAGSLFFSVAPPPPPAAAFDISCYLVPSTDRSMDVDPLDVNAVVQGGEASGGWTTLESGVSFVVDRVGEGNVERGITDTVDHYVPGPFVEVKYTVYTASDGRAFASTSAARRPYNYQAGVKDEVQDEAFGGVMGMRVGERRRFLVPPELCFKRKVFGQYAPPRDDYLLVDVELLNLQPY